MSSLPHAASLWPFRAGRDKLVGCLMPILATVSRIARLV